MKELLAALSTISGTWIHIKPKPADLERFRQHLQALRGVLLVDRQLGDSLLRAYKETVAQ